MVVDNAVGSIGQWCCNAKLASGHQNLGSGLHQSQTVLNALLHQGLEQASTTDTSGSPLARKGGQDFFRGSRNGEAPDFTPRPNEFKVDKQTGLVKDTHGVSVFDNAKRKKKGVGDK